MGVAAAVGWELWQGATGRGQVDALDAIATAAPGLVLWLILEGIRTPLLPVPA